MLLQVYNRIEHTIIFRNTLLPINIRHCKIMRTIYHTWTLASSLISHFPHRIMFLPAIGSISTEENSWIPWNICRGWVKYPEKQICMSRLSPSRRGFDINFHWRRGHHQWSWPADEHPSTLLQLDSSKVTGRNTLAAGKSPPCSRSTRLPILPCSSSHLCHTFDLHGTTGQGGAMGR